MQLVYMDGYKFSPPLFFFFLVILRVAKPRFTHLYLYSVFLNI